MSAAGKIHPLLKTKSPLTSKQISEETGIGLSTVYKVLRDLEGEGKIVSRREISLSPSSLSWYPQPEYPQPESVPPLTRNDLLFSPLQGKEPLQDCIWKVNFEGEEIPTLVKASQVGEAAQRATQISGKTVVRIELMYQVLGDL